MTDGVAANDLNNDAIVFHLLARNFESEEQFIYSVSNLKDGVFGQIVDELSQLGVPRWPIWVPLWKFEREEDRIRIEMNLEQISTDDVISNCVVICTSILQPFLAVRAIRDSVQRHELETLQMLKIPFPRWVDYVLDEER